MNIFISWSGSLSEKISREINNFLDHIFTMNLNIFLSSDIEKGKGWDEEIISNLKKSEIGVLCLTKENYNKQWVLFEAGALAVKFNNSKVIPILFDLKTTDIQFPLARFQLTQFNKEEVFKFINSINNEFGELKIKDTILVEIFDPLWPKLESNINTILKDTPSSTIPERSPDDLAAETLELVREISKSIDSSNPLNEKYKRSFLKHLGTTGQLFAATRRTTDVAIYYYYLNLIIFLTDTINLFHLDNSSEILDQLSDQRKEIEILIAAAKKA